MAKPYQTYEAYAFLSEQGDKIEGTIFFTSRCLTFQGGETVIEIPLQHLLAEFDNSGAETVTFRNSMQPDCAIATIDTSVLECRTVPQIARLAEQVESHLTSRELWRRGRMVLFFFAGCGLVLWLGMAAVGAMVRAIVAKVPPEVERHYGDELLAELKQQVEFAENTNLVAHVAAAAEPLLRVLPSSQEWQFSVINEDSPNAFALPGGHILVTTGLLHLVERPEELLGALAHEVAHVTQKHGFRRQISSAGPLLVLQIFLQGRSGALGAVAGGSALLVHQSFSQQHEQEADDTGWKYLVAANIDPRGMTDILRKLKAAEEREKHSSVLPKAFNSHPDIVRRIARLEAKWKRLPRKSGFVELIAQPL